MGLSFKKITKKITDVLGGAEHAVTHNAVTNAAGNVAKGAVHDAQAAVRIAAPVARPVVNALSVAEAATNPLTAPFAHPQKLGSSLEGVASHIPTIPKTSPARFLNNAVINPVKTTDTHVGQILQGHNPYHGTLEQKFGQAGGDVVNAASVLPIGRSAEVAAKGGALLPKVIEGAKAGFKGGAIIGGGQGATSALKKNESAKNVVKSTVINTGAGAAAGTALGAVAPAAVEGIKQGAGVVKAVVKDAKNVLPAQVASRLQEVYQPTELFGEPPKATVKPAATASIAPEAPKPSMIKNPAPEGKVATSKTTGTKSSIPEINDKIDAVSQIYSSPQKYEGGVQDIVKQAQGHSQVGLRAAQDLRTTIEKHLTPEENQQVSDILDGHTKTGTPKAKSVAKALKPLQDQGFKIRKSINPDLNPVTDYVTRIPSKSVGSKAARAGAVLGKIRNLSDIHNLNSAFSQERQVGKFVSKDGSAVYGNPKDIGLTPTKNGKFVDAQGNPFTQTAVSKRELEANGAGKYEHNISRISGIYHGDTASLKARAEALQQLQSDPANYGLTTPDKAPAGAVPVTKVPELAGLYGSKEDVSALESGFGYKNPSGPIGKAYDAVSNAVTQFIVVNPFFHGMNQLYQAGIAAGNMPGMTTGWGRVAKAVFSVTEQDVRDYLSKGGHIPDYGAHRENWLSDVTQGLTKVNSKAMAGIEMRLRTGLYKASLEAGMGDKEAVNNIDKFLGDSKHVNQTVQRATLFAHYFKTMANALGSQVVHPAENAGSIVNTAALAGITAAVTYGYQQFTGNKDAYVRVPGELGLVKEGVKSVKEVANGELPSLATNRVNPVLKEGIQQTANHDFFTQGKVSDTAPGKIGPVKLSGNEVHAINSLVAPAQTIERGAAGKRSIAETVGNQLGVYEPHAKGYQAVVKGPEKALVNTKGALAGTGMAAQNAYFNGLKEAKKELAGDKKASTALEYYLAKNHSEDTGQSIQNSPSESIQNSSALFANDKLRGAVQKFEKAQPSHDPMWDLPPARLKTYMDYKEQYTGDAAKKFILDKNPWLKDTIVASGAFYDNLPKVPGSKGSVKNPQSPDYPQFDKSTQSLLDTYDVADEDQKAALIKSNGPDLSAAWNKVATWTNQMRKAEGAPELKDYPVADAATQKVMDTYNALAKGTGARSAWIKANPGAYQKMTDYLTQASMNTLIKNAALDQFKGAEPNQELLKSIKNIGQYDISQGADGQYALGGGGSGGSTSPYSTYASRSGSSGYYKGQNALNKNNRVTAKGAKIKKAKFAKSSSVKLASKTITKPKVTIKKSKV